MHLSGAIATTTQKEHKLIRKLQNEPTHVPAQLIESSSRVTFKLVWALKVTQEDSHSRSNFTSKKGQPLPNIFFLKNMSDTPKTFFLKSLHFRHGAAKLGVPRGV